VHIRMPYRSARTAQKPEGDAAAPAERANGERRPPEARASADGRTIAGGSAGGSRG